MTTAPAPLEGFRVIEFSDTPCGAFCGRLLVLLGADVVKVEAPQRDSPNSNIENGVREHVDAGKHSLTLDTNFDEGKTLLKELVSICDVMLCEQASSKSAKPKYEEFGAAFPALVWLDITPFGVEGPWANFAASALTVHAASGALYLQPTGQLNKRFFGNRPPLKWGGHSSEFIVGMQAATAIIAALFQSQLSGHGQRVEVSRQEALMQIIRSDIAEFANGGLVRGRAGSPGQYVPLISGTMRCKDGYVAMWPLEPYMITNLATLMGNPPWSQQDWFENPFERANHAREIRSDIEAWLLDFTMMEIHELGQANHIAVTPVLNPSDVYSSRQLAARNFFKEAYTEDGRPFLMPGLPFPIDFDASGDRVPQRGQDNHLFFEELLGHGSEELAHFRSSGAI